MKMDEITQLNETTSMEKANEFLAKGYRIIKILSTKIVDINGNEIIRPVYILACKK